MLCREMQIDQGNCQTCSFHPSGVDSIFKEVGCDYAAVEERLGFTSGITETNIVTYLDLIEEKTNELLSVQAFLKFKVVPVLKVLWLFADPQPVRHHVFCAGTERRLRCSRPGQKLSRSES